MKNPHDIILRPRITEKAVALSTIGMMAIIPISLPSARVFFALSFPDGITVGIILYLFHRRPPRREGILSLHLRDVPDHRAVQPREFTHARTLP